jgi:hypothetical protein
MDRGIAGAALGKACDSSSIRLARGATIGEDASRGSNQARPRIATHEDLRGGLPQQMDHVVPSAALVW